MHGKCMHATVWFLPSIHASRKCDDFQLNIAKSQESILIWCTNRVHIWYVTWRWIHIFGNIPKWHKQRHLCMNIEIRSVNKHTLTSQAVIFIQYDCSMYKWTLCLHQENRHKIQAQKSDSGLRIDTTHNLRPWLICMVWIRMNSIKSW